MILLGTGTKLLVKGWGKDQCFGLEYRSQLQKILISHPKYMFLTTQKGDTTWTSPPPPDVTVSSRTSRRYKTHTVEMLPLEVCREVTLLFLSCFTCWSCLHCLNSKNPFWCRYSRFKKKKKNVTSHMKRQLQHGHRQLSRRIKHHTLEKTLL